MSQSANTTNCFNTTVHNNLFLLCQDRLEGVFLWMCTTVVSFVLGFPGVLALLWDLLQRGRKGGQFTPHDVFMLNNTIIDGIFLLFNFLELCNFQLWHNSDFETFVFFFYPFNMSGRPLFTACICLDCYLAVVHPVFYRANKSLTPRILTAVGVWTVTFLHSSFSVTSLGFHDSPFQLVIFALFLPIVGFCDATIFWTLKRFNPAGGSVHPKKKKALQVVINNLVITFTSYLPPVISVMVSEFMNLDRLTLECQVVISLLCSILIGNTVSPILYLCNLGKLDWLKFVCQK